MFIFSVVMICILLGVLVIVHNRYSKAKSRREQVFKIMVKHNEFAKCYVDFKKTVARGVQLRGGILGLVDSIEGGMFAGSPTDVDKCIMELNALACNLVDFKGLSCSRSSLYSLNERQAKATAGVYVGVVPYSHLKLVR